MSSIKRLVGLAIIAIVVICSLSSVKGMDKSEQEHLCSMKIDADDSKDEWDLSYLVSPLIEDTPTHGYSSHYSYNGFYGAAACNGQVSQEDCEYCLDSAYNTLYTTCGFSDGAQVKLNDCRLRFEHYAITDANW